MHNISGVQIKDCESVVHCTQSAHTDVLAGGDEFAHFRRQAADVADGAGAGALREAEGLADQIGDVGLALAGGFGGLDKHGLQYIA